MFLAEQKSLLTHNYKIVKNLECYDNIPSNRLVIPEVSYCDFSL